jgi:hypothetical protein
VSAKGASQLLGPEQSAVCTGEKTLDAVRGLLNPILQCHFNSEKSMLLRVPLSLSLSCSLSLAPRLTCCVSAPKKQDSHTRYTVWTVFY